MRFDIHFLNIIIRCVPVSIDILPLQLRCL